MLAQVIVRGYLSRLVGAVLEVWLRACEGVSQPEWGRNCMPCMSVTLKLSKCAGLASGLLARLILMLITMLLLWPAKDAVVIEL